MKRITVKQFLLCLTLVAACLFAKAQTVYCYIPGEFSVDAGSSFTANVQVDSFIDIGSCAFSIKWDPAVLQFTEVTNLAVTLNELSGVNDSRAISDGELGFIWVNPSATTGTTLADSTVLLSVSFNVVGNGGDTTSLQFTDDPVYREIADLQPVEIPSVFTGAAVSVFGTSDTYYNSAPEIISLYPPVPNPFHHNTNLKFDLEKSAQTTIKIVDQMGKVLYQDQQFLSAGLQNIPISKEIFTQSGAYYCLLNASEFRVMQKLIFIDR